MKKLSLIVLLIVLCSFLAPSTTLAVTKIRAATHLEGDDTGAMDKIDIADIAEGDIFIVFHNPDDATYPGATMFYVYDADSSAGEATPYVIYANDRSGSGAWILQSSFYFGGKANPSVDLLDSDQANQAIASFSANASDANDSIANLKVEEDTVQEIYITLDGVNEKVTAGRKIDPSAGLLVLTPVVDDPDNFASNFTGANLYGGTFIANADGTSSLPAVAAGMSFTYKVEGDLSASNPIIDPNGSEIIYLNGTSCTAGYTIVGDGETGPTPEAVFQYRSSGAWSVVADGFSCGS